MKKIYYLLAFVVLAFTACQKQPVIGSGGTNNAYVKKKMAVTLQASDYAYLDTSVYAHFTHSFQSVTDAKTYIPVILNAEYPQLSSGSTANISYNMQIKLADSVYKDITYTLTDADYLLLPGNKFTDFSASQILNWLPYKYTTPAQNQLAVLTFNYYANGTTTVSTFSYLYMDKSWQQVYMLTPAQYTAVGKGGTYNQFSASDNVPAFINALLKTDPSVSATATVGQSKFVSFNYYNSTGKVTSQRVLNFIFDGTNWNEAGNTTTAFIESNGKWIPDPTVYYTLTTADTKLIAGSTVGTSDERTNLGKYGDFSNWPDADLDAALILVLQTNFPNPTVNVDYKVTYLKYTGTDVPTTVAFIYDGTSWSVDKNAQ